MQTIGPYEICDILGVNGRYLIYKAEIPNSSEKYLIKTLRPNEIEKGDHAQLQHESALLQRLGSHGSYFPRVVGWVEQDNPLNLILKDEGFVFLNAFLTQKPLNLAVFFPIAIQLAKILSEIHGAGIIFKNINPQSIWIRPTDNAIQIADFSIATELNRTMVPSDPPRLLQGNLEYIAPEQTGRMNRPLTYAADLYSLGILFYEYLSGRLPFTSADPMTIIFGHMATPPKNLKEYDSSLPYSLCVIVMKLLSKKSEERYKSALGLMRDLEQAYQDWQAGKDLNEPFTPGLNDIATRLELPSKLYGRETETQILLNAFDRLCENRKNAIITVSGYSGVGKTSLVRELIPKIALSKGFLARGKFNKFQQSDTYEGLRQALDKLIRYQLNLPSEEYDAFKNIFLQEMGGILGVVTDFVPRLKNIVGEPEPLPKVGIEATKNRFELAILRFVKLLSLEHPLVLFLDDMQWANASFLDLLKKLIFNPDIKNVLLILSYRSNEVEDEHPLNAFLKYVESREPIQKIVVEGLKKESLNQLLEDMLHLTNQELQFISKLMVEKTYGNPFFLLMLVEELYREDVLYFSTENHRWHLDENRLKKIALTNNMLDFVAKRIGNLPIETKDSLHLAACIGGTFNLEDLAIAQKETVLLAAQSLQAALQENIIVPTQLKDEWFEGVSEEELLNREYSFQHDKIQKACYELKPTEETKRIHLELARRWAASYQESDAGTRVMAIADQFNKGLSYVVNPDEKKTITHFNFKAALVALSSTAYNIAYEYSRIAKDLLSETAWDTDYNFCYNIYFSYIQTAFLSRHFNEAALATEQSLEKAKTVMEKAKLLLLKGDLNRAAGEHATCVAFYEKAIRLLGYPNIAKIPSKLELFSAIMRFKFYLRYYRKPLQALPQETSETQEIVYSIALRLAEEMYYTTHMMRYAYLTMTWTVETFKAQSQNLRTMSYLVNSVLFPRNRLSHILYKETQDFFSDSNDAEGIAEKATFYHVGTALHAGWYELWPELLPLLHKGAFLNEKMGNLELAAWGHALQPFFDTAMPLPKLLKKVTAIKNYTQNSSTQASLVIDILSRYYLNLTGASPFNHWQDENFDIKDLLALTESQKYQTVSQMACIFLLKTMLQLDENTLLQDACKKIEFHLNKIYLGNAPYLILPAYVYLYLGKITLYPNLNLKEKIRTRIQLFKLQHSIKRLTGFCPQNFAHGEVLMGAELARLKGNIDTALKLYNKAIDLAIEHKAPEYACLAAQRALKFCVKIKQTELIHQYANYAIKLYADWGAFGIVKILQEKHAAYLSLDSKTLSSQIEPSEEDYNTRYDLDARSIMLATRVINKELQLGGLLHNTMQLLIDNTAATKAALCLMLKGAFLVEAYYDSADKKIQTLIHTPCDEANICQEIFLKTWKEKKEVLVMDVSKSIEFQDNAYLQKSDTKSLISIPIFNAEGNELVGVIYCENKLSTHSFTLDRLMVLRALSVQLSLSIDNSRLYTLFERFVPKPFLNQLGHENIFDLDAGDSVKKNMAVLFMDIRNFTSFSEKRNSDIAFHFINEYLAEVTPVIHLHHGFIDKFLGDGIMALFPGENHEALKACTIMNQKIITFAKTKPDMHLEVGMGLHYGPLMLGIVGEAEHIEGTVIGDTVNVASRLEALNKMFHTQCLVSDAVKNTISTKEHYHLRPVGRIRLLGRIEIMTVWQLLDNISDPKARALHIQQLPLFENCYKAYLERDFATAHTGFSALIKDNPEDGVLRYYHHASGVYKENPPPAEWQAEIEMEFK